MKTIRPFIVLILSCAFQGFYLSQQTIQVTLGNVNRATPKIGFNTNGHMPANFPAGYLGANWSQQSFIDSMTTLNPAVLRFPGGTNANHWDWETGWYMPGYEPPFAPLTIRPEEFQVGLNHVPQAEGLYVMNLETSTVNHEMDGLRHMNSLGLNPFMIELGNEHNLSNPGLPLQFMTSQGYAQLAKTFYDSVKAINPLSKVCVVGSNTNQRPNWNSDILAINPSIEAFAWHAYLNANNADLVFDVNRSLAEAFGDINHNGSLAFRYNTGGFGNLPPDKEVWVTEYNLWETQLTSLPVIAESWTHALYLTAMHHYFLGQSNVTMFLNHSLTSIDTWHQSISREDQHITANGVAMKLLLDVANGSQSCQDMSFAGNPSTTYNAETFPKLVGWKFNHTGVEKGFICNFSRDTFVVSLQQVFGNPMTYTSFSADTNFVVNGISSLDQFNASTTDQLTVLPYSFVQIQSPQSNNLIDQQNVQEIVMYPNPTSDWLHFSKSTGNFTIYNTLGKSVLTQQDAVSKINIQQLQDGLYFLAKDKTRIRFVVNH